ncbi:hypothetical protein AVEN_220717-1 [Araneus ventricosus]|uniref:Uncharacterized protein n=1 Tax=Araneus ventricosus TaxID=182803 RepID=A0A4Y2TVI2_ARAVE|nr:hypothetical protein AVEN_220717-1 [Araneus ventricosus]
MLEISLNSLREKCNDLVNYVQIFGESQNSFVEIQIKPKNCQCLQQKVEKLKQKYYELPETANISMADGALDKLDQRLETSEVSFKVILDILTSKKENAISTNNKGECVCVGPQQGRPLDLGQRNLARTSFGGFECECAPRSRFSNF